MSEHEKRYKLLLPCLYVNWVSSGDFVVTVGHFLRDLQLVVLWRQHPRLNTSAAPLSLRVARNKCVPPDGSGSRNCTVVVPLVIVTFLGSPVPLNRSGGKDTDTTEASGCSISLSD